MWRTYNADTSSSRWNLLADAVQVAIVEQSLAALQPDDLVFRERTS
jgi:hypothetical protein